MNEQTLNELIEKLQEQLREASFEHYFRYELFSGVWWLLIALLIIPLIVWWKLVDKKRLLQICMFGLLTGLLCTFLDVIGIDYVLWKYPRHVLPQTALLLPVDFVILPVIQMYVYQKWPTWGKFVLGSIVSAAIQAFIAEPLAILIGQYKLISWKLIYSFPIYVFLDVTIKFIVDRFKKQQDKAINKS